MNIRILAVMAIVLAGSCSSQQSIRKTPFIGTWILDKYESLDTATMEWRENPRRLGYTGYIIYDGMGHMAVQLIPPGFKSFDNSADVDSLSELEVRRILRLQFASFSYFANYTISKTGDTIDHFRISSNNPREWATTAKRIFEFKGDTLLLMATESIGGLRTRLRWVKFQ